MDFLKYASFLDDSKIVNLDAKYFFINIYGCTEYWLNENDASSHLRSILVYNSMWKSVDKKSEKKEPIDKKECSLEITYSDEFLYLQGKGVDKDVEKGPNFSGIRYFNLLLDIWKNFIFLLSVQTSDDKEFIRKLYKKYKSLSQRLQSRMGMYEFDKEFNYIYLYLFIFEFRNSIFDKKVLAELDYNLSKSSSPDLTFMDLVYLLCDVDLTESEHLNSEQMVEKFLSYLNDSMPLEYLFELSNIVYRSFKIFISQDFNEIVDHLSPVLDIKNLPLMKETFFSIFPRCHRFSNEFLTEYYKIFESFSSQEVSTDNCQDLLYEIYGKLSKVVTGKPKTGTDCSFYSFFPFITRLFTKSGLRDEVFKSTDNQSILDYISHLSFVFKAIRKSFSDIGGLNNFDAATISKKVDEIIENRLYNFTANQVFSEINLVLADDSNKEKTLNSFFEAGISYGNSDPDILSLQSRPQNNNVHEIFKAISHNNKLCENILSSEISLLKLSHSNVVAPNFDYTNYVVGYIKGVERYLKEVLAQYFPNNIYLTEINCRVTQLLFDTIDSNRQNRLTAEDLSKKRPIPPQAQNSQAYTRTLECGTAFYSLRYALRNCRVSFISNQKQNQIYNLLFNNNVRDSNHHFMSLNDTWIQKVRNGYLHIDIVDSVQKAMDIREKTSFWLGYTIYILRDFQLTR